MSAVPDVAPNSSPARIKRRRWYIAVLLSFLCPGLGQLYNTQGRRALTIVAIFAGAVASLLVLTHFAALSLAVFFAMVAIVVAMVALFVFQLVDAGVGARRRPAALLRRYNRVWIYLLAIAAAYPLGSLKPKPLAGTSSWSTPTASMSPTLLVGDYYLAEKGYFDRHAPHRGDLAIYKRSSDRRIDYVRRVVGLPGDTIQMVGGRLHINGVVVTRERIEVLPDKFDQEIASFPQFIETLTNGRRYRIREDRGDHGPLDNTPPYLVPADHYFVLGDNRDNSHDSRFLTEVGFVPRANFSDRPAYIYWSRDWSRIGRIE